MRLLLTAIFTAAFACGTARAVMPEIKTPVTVRGTVTDVFFDPVDTGFMFLILAKLNASNRAEAVAIALRKQLLKA